MKRILGILFCCLWAGMAWGQYAVLHVRGNIVLQSTGKAVSLGQAIKAGDGVKFQSADAQLSLLHLEKGRFCAKIPPDSLRDFKDKFVALDKVAKPSVAYPHYPLKAKIRTQDDFKAHFDRPYLLMPGTAVPLDTGGYVLGEFQVFYVRFLHKSLNAEVPTRLPVRNDSLLLDPAQFLNMNGVPVTQADATDMSIRYTQARKNHVWVCNFRPVYFDPVLYKEVDLLSDLLPNSTSPEVKKKWHDPDEYYNFVCEAWGIPDYAAFMAWMKRK